MIKTAKVLPYQQETQHTCSSASLKAVMAHWGLDVPEKVVSVRIRVHKRRGAETDQIVAAAKKFGFDAFQKSFTMDEAERLTKNDIPIICDIQSFTKPGSGHYVVLTHLDSRNAVLMDPNVKGNVRILPRDEFEERWWDRQMFPPHNLMKRWGIVVIPKKKVKLAKFDTSIPKLVPEYFKWRHLRFPLMLAGMGGLVGAGGAATSPEIHKRRKKERRKALLNAALGSGLTVTGITGLPLWKGVSEYGRNIQIGKAHGYGKISDSVARRYLRNDRLRTLALLGLGTGLTYAGVGRLRKLDPKLKEEDRKSKLKRLAYSSILPIVFSHRLMRPGAGYRFGYGLGRRTKAFEDWAEDFGNRWKSYSEGGYSARSARAHNTQPPPPHYASAKTQKEVKNIYKRRARKHHPDLQKTEEARRRAEEEMKKINEEFDRVRNSEWFKGLSKEAQLKLSSLFMEKLASYRL